MTSKRKSFFASLIMVIIAMIWGGSFVAQSKGGEIAGPFGFGFVRFMIAGIAVLPVIFIRSKKAENKVIRTKAEKLTQLKSGVVCGVFLTGTSAFQQLGMYYGTVPGKAGFLTSCYIVFVPIISLVLFKKKSALNVWIAVCIALVGLYLLCIKEGFSAQLSDGIVLMCSVMIASRILAVDRYKDKVDIIKMACIQFFTASIILGILACIFEIPKLGIAQWWNTINCKDVWVALVYAGLLAGAMAFTLQNVVQKYIKPTIASLLMSLESVFSVLAGWIVLGDVLGARELIGCAVIFVALVIAELKFENKQKVEICE